MRPTIAIVATLDTKGRETAYLRDKIEAHGCTTLIVDVGVFPQSETPSDVSGHDVSLAGGMPIDDLLATGDRSLAVRTMAAGGAEILKRLHEEGRFAGVISMGGGTGTNIAAGIMQALPVGLPKLLVSTVASRDMSAVVGNKDITLMHAVADLIGLNFMTRKILSHAAAAVVAMVRSAPEDAQGAKAVGLTSYGPLNQCAFTATRMLTDLGYEVVPFHAVGSGSMAMEDLVEQGVLHGVLDLSLHEFADHMYNGYCKGIGPSRLTTPGRMGVPHVILPGGLDMIAFECTSLDGFPAQLRHRKFLSHDFRSFVRTDGEDLRAIARVVRGRLNGLKRLPTVVIPLNGWSKADSPGAPFYDPELDGEFTRELKAGLSGDVRIIELNTNINDEECASVAVSALHELMKADS